MLANITKHTVTSFSSGYLLKSIDKTVLPKEIKYKHGIIRLKES